MTLVTTHGYRILLCDETFKIYSLSNFQTCSRVLLAVLSALQSLPRASSSYNRTFVPFDPIHPFCPSPIPHLCYHQSLLCIYELFFFSFFFVDSTYKWDHTVFAFSIRLFALSVMPSKSIRVVTNAKFPSFLWLSNNPSTLLSMHFPLTKLHLLFYTYHDKTIIYCLTILSMGNVRKLNLLIMSCFFVCECISSLVTKHHGHICTCSLAPPTIPPPAPIFPACKPHHEEHLQARVSTFQGSESPRNQAPCPSACWGDRRLSAEGEWPHLGAQ